MFGKLACLLLVADLLLARLLSWMFPASGIDTAADYAPPTAAAAATVKADCK